MLLDEKLNNSPPLDRSLFKLEVGCAKVTKVGCAEVGCAEVG